MVVNKKNQASMEKIFTGGDAVKRTADAITAIADGHRAENEIEKNALK